MLADVDQSMPCMTRGDVRPDAAGGEGHRRGRGDPARERLELRAVGHVWTGDRARGERVARRLEVGAVNVNDVLANGFSFALPMPGWKQSGIGPQRRRHGILKYCRTQAITAPRLATGSRELFWYPLLAAQYW